MTADAPMIPYLFPGQSKFLQPNVFDQLLQKRLIFLNQAVDSEIANQIIAAMLYLGAEEPEEDIRLHINFSSGSSCGSLVAAIAIYDTMQRLNADVSTVCTGAAESTGTFLLSVGTPGKRLALPHTRIMLNQPKRMMAEVPTTDISIEAKEQLILYQKCNEIMAQKTGQPIERITKDAKRGFFLSAQEAEDYGLIDQVISH